MGLIKPFRKKTEFEEQENEVSFSDRFAMWLSGVLVIGLPCIILIVIIIGVTLLLFS